MFQDVVLPLSRAEVLHLFCLIENYGEFLSLAGCICIF